MFQLKIKSKIISLIFHQQNIRVLMSIDHSGTDISHNIRELIVNRMNHMITRRNFIYSNVNNCSVDQIKQLFDQINQQLTLNAPSSTIQSVDDHENIHFDTLMSLSESKIRTLQQINKLAEGKNRKTSFLDDGARKSTRNRRRTMVSFQLKKSESNTPNSRTHSQNMVPLNQSEQVPQQSQKIQLMRLSKINEQQHQRRKKQRQSLIKERKIIDLTGKRLVYDYDYRVTEYSQIKPRRYQTIENIKPRVEQRQYNYQQNARLLAERNSKNHIEVKNKLNVTKKEIDQQIRKKGKSRFAMIKQAKQEAEPINTMIHINQKSHQEITEVMKVDQPGVKVFINFNQYYKVKDTPRKQLTITRRLTKAQYNDFKSDLSMKKLINRSKIQESPKVKTEGDKSVTIIDPKTDPKSTVKKNSFSLFDQGKSNDSRVFIHHKMHHGDLIRDNKTATTIDPPSIRPIRPKSQFSLVDQYNLLYTKYDGYPPVEAFETIVKQLRQNTSKASKMDSNKLTQYKKKSWVNNNRFRLQKTAIH